MNANTDKVRAVESLMLEKFRTEPFQNLHLLQGRQPSLPEHGGTCSDKTLNFIHAAKRAGIDASLHTGFIGGEEIHRLARVQIDGEDFFADVGNGWPALRLYPTNREISYGCFGMNFRTEISAHRMAVFHRRNGTESLQLEIEFRPKPEAEILADIASRFRPGAVYPFSNSVRFSLVVDQRFLFLRGERLEIYGDGEFEVVEGIGAAQVPAILREHFRFDYERVLGLPPTRSTEKSG